MNRKETLDAAERCVNGKREHDYGKPEDNFSTIAELWTSYLRRSGSSNITVTAHDVTVMMVLLKIGRIAGGQTKDDNYIDGCGYLACAAELATANTVKPSKEYYVKKGPRCVVVGDDERTVVMGNPELSIDSYFEKVVNYLDGLSANSQPKKK